MGFQLKKGILVIYYVQKPNALYASSRTNRNDGWILHVAHR